MLNVIFNHDDVANYVLVCPSALVGGFLLVVGYTTAKIH